MSMRRFVWAALFTLAVSSAIVPAAVAAPPPPHPRLSASVTVQVPGVVWGIGGAGLANPRVFYGHGRIYPYPVGYGYRWHWRNLTTGRAGVIYDYPHRRTTIRTGAGQLLVTGEFYPQPNLYVSTPAVATFYVNP